MNSTTLQIAPQPSPLKAWVFKSFSKLKLIAGRVVSWLGFTEGYMGLTKRISSKSPSERSPLSLEPGENPPFTFCEGVHASSTSPWHIRKTTAAGPKFGGGIDTPSLCGHVTPPSRHGSNGWDLEVRISEKHLQHCCAKCAEEYRKLVSK